jgi:protein-export membrane protein SecD
MNVSHATIAVLLATLAASGCGADAPRAPRTRVVYELDVEPPAREQALAQAVATISERIRAHGISGAKVVAEDEQIVVELPGSDQDALQRTLDVIARKGTLSVQRVDGAAPLMTRLADVVGVEGASGDPDARERGIVAVREEWNVDGGATRAASYLLAVDREEQVTLEEARAIGCAGLGRDEPSGQVRCAITGRRALEGYLHALGAREPSLRVPADHELVYERVSAAGGRPAWRTYYLARAPSLDGRNLRGAELVPRAAGGQPAIVVTFDADGARTLAELTTASVGDKLAIVVDGVVRSAPIVQAPISGGQVSITLGTDTRDPAGEARALVEVLRAGALPAPLREASRVDVRPMAQP